mgnify:CR=1 FL=1
MNINEVRKLIYKHGEKIGLPYDSKLYPIFSSTGKVFSDGGTIYISNNEYHYVIMERGKEINIIEAWILMIYYIHYLKV